MTDTFVSVGGIAVDAVIRVPVLPLRALRRRRPRSPSRESAIAVTREGARASLPSRAEVDALVESAS